MANNFSVSIYFLILWWRGVTTYSYNDPLDLA